MSQIEEVLDRIRTAAGVEGYVIVNNAGEVLRKMPGLASDRASMIGAEVGRLAKKASSVVRDLDPKNTLSYLRLRAREKELLVAPGPDYLVVVIQRWKPAE